jgi:SAM-dependent methyltransferase
VTWHVGDAGALPFAAGQFDCVGSSFGVIHAADMRDAASELERVLRPGGRLGLATWSSTGAMGAVLRAARKADGPAARRTRPERWGSYEGLHLALDRFPGFDVSQPMLEWRYADRDALWHDLAEPPGPLSAAATDRTLVEERLAPFLRQDAGALVLRVEWCLVLAVRPD